MFQSVWSYFFPLKFYDSFSKSRITCMLSKQSFICFIGAYSNPFQDMPFQGERSITVSHKKETRQL